MPYKRLKILKGYIDRALGPYMRVAGGLGVRPIHITLLSLPFGVLGVLLVYDRPALSAVLIGSYIILDVLDGTLARATGTASEFGAQVDFLFDRIVASLFLITLYLRTGEWALPAVGLIFIAAFTLEEVGLIRR